MKKLNNTVNVGCNQILCLSFTYGNYGTSSYDSHGIIVNKFPLQDSIVPLFYFDFIIYIRNFEFLWILTYSFLYSPNRYLLHKICICPILYIEKSKSSQ